MKKEKLTKNIIKKDLQNEVMKKVMFFLGIFLPFLVFLAFSIFIFGRDDIALFYKLGMYCCVFVMFIISLKKGMEIARLLMLFSSFCIVEDKLVGMDIRMEKIKERVNSYQTYNLYFSGYGEYKLPDTNYVWSDMFSMKGKQVYERSKCGDKFYLVLSNKHNGKILYAYCLDFFEFEELDSGVN